MPGPPDVPRTKSTTYSARTLLPTEFGGVEENARVRGGRAREHHPAIVLGTHEIILTWMESSMVG